MPRKQKFIRRYGKDAARVLSSIANVATAGRSKNSFKIAKARADHYALMARLG